VTTVVPRTIRGRVTVLAVTLTAMLLIGASVLMIGVLRWQLIDNLDENLAQRADAIAADLGDGQGGGFGGDEDLLVQVIASDGTTATASSNLAGAAPIAPLVPGYTTTSAVPGRSETFRVLTRKVDTDNGPGYLLVGINRDDVTDPLRIMTRTLALTVPAVVFLLGVLTWWLIGRVLRPVDTMRAQMAEITASNLGGRIPEPGTGDEIDRLARTMNETLARVEDAVRHQQRFVADASHELRSPLTRIRTELEVDLSQPPASADPIATERSVLDETIALQRLVDDLLHLARSDAGATDLVGVSVDLDDIVLTETRRLAERGRVIVDSRRVSAANVTGAPSQLMHAVQNLLDNAERHASTTVTITLAETDGLARLTVSDDGDGIAADKRDEVFERFTRLDEARTRDAGGTGLGLAITRDIIERHGGTIRLAEGPDTTFVIELPARR
jgi:signal transduction histidine kinase